MYYGTVKRAPGKITSMITGNEERICTIEYAGQEYKVFWPATKNGKPNPMNKLQVGDTVALEWTGQKFRIAAQQEAGLLEALKKRQVAAPPVAAPPTVNTPPTVTAPSTVTTPSIEEDCEEMVRIFTILRRALQSAPDDVIQAMCCTIWIQRHRK